MRNERITTHDVRACARVIGECVECGADAHSWLDRALDAMREMVGAQVTIGGNMQHFSPDRKPIPLGSIRKGWATKHDEKSWQEYTSVMPVTRTPEFDQLARFTGPIVTRRRNQLWDERVWYNSVTFNEFHKASGIDDYIISIVAVREMNLFNSIWLHRPVGAKPFGRREAWLVQFIHASLGEMIGKSIASPLEPGTHGLTPRQKDTLDCLLDGDSEKQVAYRLGVSPTTVHEYVVALYRHFGVQSRGELLARFVGRARPRFVDDGSTD